MTAPLLFQHAGQFIPRSCCNSDPTLEDIPRGSTLNSCRGSQTLWNKVVAVTERTVSEGFPMGRGNSHRVSEYSKTLFVTLPFPAEFLQ